MKNTFQKSIFIACICSFLAFSANSQCALNGVYISEILPDPNGANNFDTDGDGSVDTNDEFIELTNSTGVDVDISGWIIYYEGSTDVAEELLTIGSNTCIPANGSIVIISSWETTVNPLPNGVFEFNSGSSTGVLGNGGEVIVICDNGTTNNCIKAVYNGQTGAIEPAGSTLLCTEDFGSDSDGLSIQNDNAGNFSNATPTPNPTNPVCSAPAACDISDINLTNISACSNVGSDMDGSNDTYTADVTVTFSNPPATGNLDLSGDGTASVAVTGLTTSHTFPGVTLPANGSAISLTATFSADASCTITNSNVDTAPLACSNAAICNIPDIEIIATCTDDSAATDVEAGQNMFFLKVTVNSLGSDSDGDNEVSVTVNSASTSYSALGTYFLGPYPHSGTGTGTITASYSNDGESCSESIIVSEVLCGYTTDNDGVTDGTAEDDLHASGAACDCENAPDGFVLAQVAPGSFDPSISIMVYILVDSDGDIVAFNHTGLFVGLGDDTYDIYPYNLDLADETIFENAITLASPYNLFTAPAGSCSAGCGTTQMTLDCDCRFDDVAVQKMLTSAGSVFAVGEQVTFDIIVHNQGTHPVYNVSVVDYLPAGLDFFTADNLGNDFFGNLDTPGGGTVTTTVATTMPILNGETDTLKIVLRINAAAMPSGSVTNSAEILAADEDLLGTPIKDSDNNLADVNPDISNETENTLGAPGDEDDFDFAIFSICPLRSATVNNPDICKGTTSAPIIVTTTDAFEHMLINYDMQANSVGFTDILTVGSLGVNGESHVVPPSLTEGTYSGTITLVSLDACTLEVPFTITITCPNCGTFPWTGSK